MSQLFALRPSASRSRFPPSVTRQLESCTLPLLPSMSVVPLSSDGPDTRPPASSDAFPEPVGPDQSRIALMESALREMREKEIPSEIIECVSTLIIYATNLLDHPDEKRFRAISAVNVHFRARVGVLIRSADAMCSLGYVHRGSLFRLDSDMLSTPVSRARHLATLAFIIDFLKQEYHDLKERFALGPDRTDPETHQFSSVSGVGMCSDRGPRQTMEDDEIIQDAYGGDSSALFVGVYDGHGGRETVDFVVRTLHVNFLHSLRHHSLSSSAAAAERVPATVASTNGLTLVEPGVTMKDTDHRIATRAPPAESGCEDAPGAARYRTAFAQAYLRTDAQLRRANLLRSGSTSVTCLVKQVPRSGPDSYDSNTDTVDAAGSADTAAACETDRVLYCANAGDSRAVLLRGKTAVRLSYDHKASCPYERRRVAAAGGYVADSRVAGMLAVTRALGDHLLKGETDVVSAAPHTSSVVLGKKDRLLILACDGVWDVMEDQEAADAIAQSLFSHIAAAAALHVARLVKKGEVHPDTSAQRPSAPGSPPATEDQDPLWWLGASPWKEWVESQPGIVLNEAMKNAAHSLVRLALFRKSRDNLTAIIVLL